MPKSKRKPVAPPTGKRLPFRLKRQGPACGGVLFLTKRGVSSVKTDRSSIPICQCRQELRIDVKRLQFEQQPRSGVVMLGTILIIILILILIGSLPTWPYSGGWGYYPSGGFGLLVVIVIVLLLMGRI
jgi:hypothetical protein